MEKSSVSLGSQRQYQRMVEGFKRWCLQTGRTLQHEKQIDAAAVVFLDELYFDGALARDGGILLASVQWEFSEMCEGKGMLKRLRKALKSFRRLAPGRVRLPLPWAVVAMLINHMVLLGSRLEALIAMIQHICYLRPGVAARLHWK